MAVKVTNPRDQVGRREEEGMRVKEERDLRKGPEKLRKRILPVALRPTARCLDIALLNQAAWI